MSFCLILKCLEFFYLKQAKNEIFISVSVWMERHTFQANFFDIFYNCLQRQTGKLLLYIQDVFILSEYKVVRNRLFWLFHHYTYVLDLDEMRNPSCKETWTNQMSGCSRLEKPDWAGHLIMVEWWWNCTDKAEEKFRRRWEGRVTRRTNNRWDELIFSFSFPLLWCVLASTRTIHSCAICLGGFKLNRREQIQILLSRFLIGCYSGVASFYIK